MGTIAYSAAMSHAPGMAAAPDAAPAPQRDRFFAAAAEARRKLEAARPDLIVAMAPDHFANFFVDNMPAFCVGLNERYAGPVEKWLGMDPLSVPGAPDFARQLLWTAFEAELETAFSESLELEHGLVVPLQLLTPAMDVPIVWVMINCLVPPLPRLRRCYQLGEIVGKVVERRHERVAVIGTGGLSHAPGAPEAGDIDEAFDREFLALMEKGDGEAVVSLSDERIDKAGFGAWEIRPWVAVLGAVPERRGRALAYEAVKEWDTGCAVVLFE